MPLHGELLDRGVWILPLLSTTGQRLMVAVGTDHHWLAYQTFNVGDAGQELRARRMLHESLAKLDPRPRLEVVS